MADSKIQNLPAAGTLAIDTAFPVQKAGASDAAKVTIANISAGDEVEMVANNTSKVKFVTPNAFYQTLGNVDSFGITKTASDAEILAKTVNNRTLTPGKIPKLEDAIFALDYTVLNSWVDADSSNCTCSATTLKGYKFGKIVLLTGQITVTKTGSSQPFFGIAFNNLPLPAFAQAMAVSYQVTTDVPRPFGGAIKKAGSQLIMQVGREETYNIDQGNTMTLNINVSYICE